MKLPTFFCNTRAKEEKKGPLRDHNLTPWYLFYMETTRYEKYRSLPFQKGMSQNVYRGGDLLHTVAHGLNNLHLSLVFIFTSYGPLKGLFSSSAFVLLTNEEYK